MARKKKTEVAAAQAAESVSPASAPVAVSEPAPAAAPSTTPLYDAAMEQRRAGTLKRKALTEKGWVTP